MLTFLRHNAYALAIPALWCVWGLYWWWSSHGVKANRRRESLSSRLGHIVPLAIAILLLAPDHLPMAWLSAPLLPRTPALYPIGVALTVAGLLITVWARVRLGRNWSATVTIKADHELVDNGPYRYMRHPIYSGLLLAFIGGALARDELRGLLAVVIVFAALWRKLKLEERWMLETFGAAYQRYRQRVRALIPGLL